MACPGGPISPCLSSAGSHGHALRPVLRQAPFAVAVFRQATWGGAFVNLGAVDGHLARWVALRGGRLPAPCTPSRCELVQIGGAPAAPKLSFLHVVGRATFRPGAPLNAYFAATGGRRPPILLANGVRGFSRTPLPDAATIARTYGWIVPVAPGTPARLGAARLPGATRPRANHAGANTDLFTIVGGADRRSLERATGGSPASGCLILQGDAAVLLLGFAVLASTRLRHRDHQAVAPPADVVRSAAVAGAARRRHRSPVIVTVVSSIIGAGLRAPEPARPSRGTSAHPGGLRSSTPCSPASTVAIASRALALLTAVVMLVTLRTEPVSFGGVKMPSPGRRSARALGAVLLALAAKRIRPRPGRGTGVVLLLLPGLVLRPHGRGWRACSCRCCARARMDPPGGGAPAALRLALLLARPLARPGAAHQDLLPGLHSGLVLVPNITWRRHRAWPPALDCWAFADPIHPTGQVQQPVEVDAGPFVTR